MLLALCLFAGLHISEVNGAALWDSAGVVVTRLLQVGLCQSYSVVPKRLGDGGRGVGGGGRMGKPGGVGGGGNSKHRKVF